MRRALIPLLLLSASLGAMEETFRTYWYDQGAEISRYELRQSRYGEVRAGDAILLFVTEPLSTTGQVKSDDPDAADAVEGLKLNARRTFTTGIYPYACMTTVLQPIADGGPHPLKVTTSVQEWCGHVFEQINRLKDGWRYRLLSYFEDEGDQDRVIAEPVWLEDELWTRLRLDPDAIPTGRVRLVPGALARRFGHIRAQAEQAVCSITARDSGLRELALRYTDIQRELRITFDGEFPHEIIRWSETVGGEVTTAERTHRVYGPYWEWNGTRFEQKRQELGLD